LGALSPWWVRLLTSRPGYLRAEKGVALLAFAFALYAGYTVLAIGSGRARRTQLNWVVTGFGALVNVGLNVWLIPKYGLVGAAIATLAGYAALFVAMTAYAQTIYPVPYQWRRIVTVLAAAAALNVAARAPHLPLAPSFLLVAAYPLALLLLGFYLPAERQRLRRLVSAAL
ncbi:MAG: polysaccharide biosynthesis C-terminal domain-containing protein, partial [Actinobacteria bacterium]|nr:polysaccharide biosynthesis C-terminal domain-containing protein [Actinomycetota bacterium]